MRITFLAPTLKLTGGIIVAKKYADYLHDAGHVVTFVGIHKTKGFFEDAPYDVRNVSVSPAAFLHNLLFDLLLVRRICKTVPVSDVVIPIFSPLVVHAIACKKMKKTSRVAHLYQDAKNIRYFGFYNRVIFRLPWVYNNIDITMPITNVLKKHYLAGKSRPTVLLPNAVELDIFRPRDVKRHPKRVLFVGTKRKGLETYRKIAFQCLRHDDSIEFFTVTPDVVRKPIPSNMRIVDVGKDRGRLAELFSSAALFISLSSIDSFGLTPLEAMACGTPVLAERNTGIMDYCRDKENCILIRTREVSQVVTVVRKLLHDADLLNRLRISGLATAREYVWERSFELLSAVLVNLDA